MKPRHPAQRLTIFNHKGGVGKTTLTVNIGAALASRGKRVLLVDSDPQCNLTSFFFEDSSVDELLDKSGQPGGRTLWSAVKPVSDGTGPIRKINALATTIPNLFIVPGDIRLSEFEQVLTDAWTDCFKRRPGGFRATSAMSTLVSQLCEQLKLDFVIYDTGPNIGPLNRVILLDCDYFIVPVACDLFSVRALGTLGQSLKNWIVDWATLTSLAPDEVPLLPGRPRYLGFIPQRFKVYGQLMAEAPSYYLGQVKARMFSDVVSVLRKLDPSLAPDASVDTRLGQVKEFNSIVQLAQQQGSPLWLVTGGTPAQREEAQKAFAALADKILKLLAAAKGRPQTTP